MFLKVVNRSFMGLGLAYLITFTALTALTVQHIEMAVVEVWVYMLSSMILGVYFGIASLIFEIEKWSPLRQLAVHFVLSVILWLLIAIFMVGWIPFTLLSVVISFGVFVGLYLLFWLGFNAYYKKIETEMNDSMK